MTRCVDHGWGLGGTTRWLRMLTSSISLPGAAAVISMMPGGSRNTPPVYSESW